MEVLIVIGIIVVFVVWLIIRHVIRRALGPWPFLVLFGLFLFIALLAECG